MQSHNNVIRLSDIPSEPMKAPEGSSFGGKRQRVAVAVGARKLGYSFFTVSPGMAAFPFHLHNSNEEMIYIVEGKGTLRLGKEKIPVSAESFIAFPPGPNHPHQLINTSTNDLRYFVVSTMDYPEISEYPDSTKIGAYVTSSTGAPQAGFRALYRKDSDVSYFDGENGAGIEEVKKTVR